MLIINEFKFHEIEKENFINKLLSDCSIKNLKKIYEFFLNELKRNNIILDSFFTDKKKPIVFNNDKFLKKEILIKAVNEINRSNNYNSEIQNIKKLLLLTKNSHKFYLKKSFNTDNSYIKNHALFLADIEYSHLITLEYIIKNTNMEMKSIKKNQLVKY